MIYWLIAGIMALSAIIAGDDYFCDGKVDGNRGGGSYDCENNVVEGGGRSW